MCMRMKWYVNVHTARVVEAWMRGRCVYDMVHINIHAYYRKKAVLVV